MFLCHVAIQCGRVEIAKFLLQKGVDATAEIEISRTTCCVYSEPLLIACELGYSEIVDFLLSPGLRQEYVTPHLLQFALLISSDQGNEKLVLSLLNARANPNGVVFEGEESVAYHKSFDPSPLILACRKGHGGVVDLLLRSGAQANCFRPADSYTPLHVASDTGHAEIVDQLLKYKADPNAKANDNVTPVHLAAKRGAVQVVELLLNSAASVDAKTKEGSTPLLWAAEFGRSEVGKVLLASGACVNVKNENSCSPLYFAVVTNNSLLVKYILEHSPVIDDKIHAFICHAVVRDPCYSDIIDDVIEHGFTLSPEDLNDCDLLEAATKKGYAKIVELYLNDTNLNSEFMYELSLLHVAVQYGQKQIVKLLVDAGWDVNAKNQLGYTPVYYISNHSESLCMELIELLLRSGADIQQASILLFGAINSMYLEVFKILIENGADANVLDADGNTPLHFTVSKKSLFAHNQTNEADFSETLGSTITKLLLSSNADLAALNENGFVAIYLAAFFGVREAVRILLDHGADVNSRSEDNITPLHLTPYHADLECVDICQIFLANGADVNAIDSQSRSPLHLAVSQAYAFLEDRFRPSEERNFYQTNRRGAKEKIVELLLSNGANVNSKTVTGFTALHYAAQIYGRRRIVDILLGHRADVDCPAGEDEWTPLGLAIKGGHADIVQSLLCNGANAEARQHNGQKPVHLAAQLGLFNIVLILLKYNADADAYCFSNETLLHYAVKNKCQKTVAALLSNGCDINIKNSGGKTAFELAIVQAQRSQDPGNDGNDGKTAFERAILQAGRSQNPVNDGNDDNEDIDDEDPGFCLPLSIDDLILIYFKNHLVKLKVAGLYVREELLRLVKFNAKVIDLQEKCEVEVDRMKCRTILDKYTLHSVFVKQNNPRHMRNEYLVNTLEAFDYSDYPFYATLLRSIFKRSKERLKLLDSAIEWLLVLMKTSNTLNAEKFPLPPLLVAEEILSNLSKRDLKNLIHCGETLKSQLFR